MNLVQQEAKVRKFAPFQAGITKYSTGRRLNKREYGEQLAEVMWSDPRNYRSRWMYAKSIDSALGKRPRPVYWQRWVSKRAKRAHEPEHKDESACGHQCEVNKAVVTNLHDAARKLQTRITKETNRSFDTIVTAAYSAATRLYYTDLAAALGVDRHRVSRCATLRNVFDVDPEERMFTVWGDGGNKLSIVAKKLIWDFWEAQTQKSSNTKDVTVGVRYDGEVITAVKQYQQDTMSELYTKFNKRHPNVCALTSFCTHRPFFVKARVCGYMCMCIVHSNTYDDVRTLKRLRAKVHKCQCQSHDMCTHSDTECGRGCQCTLCVEGKCRHNPLAWDDIMDTFMCPRDAGGDYKPECVRGACSVCGGGRRVFAECPLEQKVVVEWTNWSKEMPMNPSEQDVARVMKVPRKGLGKDFLKQFKKNTAKFIAHTAIQRHQKDQFDSCWENPPFGDAVVVADFSENFSHDYQSEVQLAHYIKVQTSLFPFVIKVHAPESTPDNPVVNKLVFVLMSEDKKHDSAWAQAALAELMHFLHHEGYKPRRIHLWTDGAPTHFKTVQQLDFATRFFTLFGVFLVWNFHQSYHGKCDSDGIGAVVKRYLRWLILKMAKLIRDCTHAIALLKKHEDDRERKETDAVKKQAYLHLQASTIASYRESQVPLNTVSGVRSLYAIHGGSRDHEVVTSFLSCYCSACRKDFSIESKDCEHRELIGSRSTATITPKPVPTEEQKDANAFAKTLCTLLKGHDLLPDMDGRVLVKNMKTILRCLDVPESSWKKLKAPQLKAFLADQKLAIAQAFNVQIVLGKK